MRQRFIKIPMRPEDGLTFFQRGLLAYVEFRAGKDKDYMWSRQGEMALDLGVSRATIRRGLQDLSDLGLITYRRRQHDTRIELVQSDATELEQVGSTEMSQLGTTESSPVGAICPPVVPTCTNSIYKGNKEPEKNTGWESKKLLEEWNKKFPQTTRGANQLLDENAIGHLLNDPHNLSAGDVRALMDSIEADGAIGYYPRPLNLLRKSSQGNGTYNYVLLQLKAQPPRETAQEAAVAEMDARIEARRTQ